MGNVCVLWGKAGGHGGSVVCVSEKKAELWGQLKDVVCASKETQNIRETQKQYLNSTCTGIV